MCRKTKFADKEWKEKRVLTVDEQKRVEQVALEFKNPLSFAVYLALYTGMRVGELGALRISDVDFDNNEIHVRRTIARVHFPGCKTGRRTRLVINSPKTKKSIRNIPIPAFVAEKLKLYIANTVRRREILKEIYRDYDVNYEPKKWVHEDLIFMTQLGTPFSVTDMNRKVLGGLLDVAGV